MTPVPIDLPVRPSEAAALAELIYEQAAGRRLTEDTRSRLAGRTSTLGLKTITPYFGSLEADPVHPSTYYVAIDGLAESSPVALLLHMAPASAPASALFPKPLLIGRMRPSAEREIVMNAIGFGHGDAAAISTYATELARTFLPRAHGPLPLIWVDTGGDARAAFTAMAGFRSLLRTTGLNLAGLRCGEGGMGAFWSMVWAAIRAGYRDGYSVAGDFHPDLAKWLSCFRVRPDNAESAVHLIRSVRGGVPFDLELDLRGAGDIGPIHERLKAAGVAPQFALSESGASYPGALASVEIAAGTPEQARAGRQLVHGQCATTLRPEGSDAAVAAMLDALR